MSDFWAWVEVDEEVIIRPILGYVRGRRNFPPQPQSPGVGFWRFDPVTPEVHAAEAPNRYEIFEDYNVWAGWNRNKSMTVVGLTYDTTFEATPSSHVPWLAKVDTTSDILEEWIPDLDNLYLIPNEPENFLQIQSQLRFIPVSNNVSFMATSNAYPQPHIFRLDTSSMTVDVVATPQIPTKPIYGYCWSYDGAYVAINAPWGDEATVRVFSRTGTGDVIAQVSSDDVFGFNVAGFGFTDNSRYLYAWDGSHHVVNDGIPPFSRQWEYPMTTVGGGLSGEETFSLNLVLPDPTHSYWFRSGYIALGLGGFNTMSDFLDWDGNLIARGGGGYGGLHGDWTQDGAAIMLTDDGRDPYGGHVGITKIPSLEGDGTSEQEIADIRIRPFHGIY